MESVSDKFQAGIPVEPKEVRDTRRHATVSNASTKDRVTININESDDPKDLNEVLVQVNGRAYQIQRGKDVAIPPEVVQALENAVIDRAIPNVDEQGQVRGFTLRPTKRFPFTISGEDKSQAIYRKWKQASIDLRNAQVAAAEAAEELAA